jgi:hypothetical protein
MAAALENSDALPTQFDVTTFPRDVEQYLEHTENPFHRAMLKNYFRHLLLEVSSYWDQILVPELTIDEPVYRIGHVGSTIVLRRAIAIHQADTLAASVSAPSSTA